MSAREYPNDRNMSQIPVGNALAASMCASASFFCTSWNDAKGRLNCLLCQVQKGPATDVRSQH
jgi:hypothetical protein